MNPDLYGAWLAAGDWLTHTWPWLVTAACALFAVWAFCQAIGDDYRTSNDHVAAQRTTRLEDRPEPGQPGSNDELLEKCRAICPDIRKEKP